MKNKPRMAFGSKIKLAENVFWILQTVHKLKLKINKLMLICSLKKNKIPAQSYKGEKKQKYEKDCKTLFGASFVGKKMA